MSMIGMGMQAAGYASQMLSSLLSDLSSTTSTSSTTDTPSSSTFSGDCSAASSSGATSSNALTGSTKASLGGQVLMTLMHMQDDTSQSGSATGASDPLQNLFSAMDSDGDGSVSQSEMESYIQNAGGTTTQADQLYSMLGGTTSTSGSTATSTGGITENQMASQLPAQQAGGGHHGHRHHAHGAGGSNGADALLQALDTNNDGSVSQDELSNFVTSNGGTQDEATSDFSALDTTGAGSLSSADFANAWENLQNGSSSSNSSMLSVLNAFASANTAAASTTSVTA